MISILFVFKQYSILLYNTILNKILRFSTFAKKDFESGKNKEVARLADGDVDGHLVQREGEKNKEKGKKDC